MARLKGERRSGLGDLGTAGLGDGKGTSLDISFLPLLLILAYLFFSRSVSISSFLLIHLQPWPWLDGFMQCGGEGEHGLVVAGHAVMV